MKEQGQMLSEALLWLVWLQALVDAPGQARRVVNFKRLALTDLKIDIPRLATKKVITAKFSEAGELQRITSILLSSSVHPAARTSSQRNEIGQPTHSNKQGTDDPQLAHLQVQSVILIQQSEGSSRTRKL